MLGMSICILCQMSLSLLPRRLSRSVSQVSRDSVIFKERLGPRKLHGVTLDEDEMNPLGSVVEQLRPAGGPLGVLSRQRNRTIKGHQRFKSIDHLSARRKISFGCLL